MIANERFTVFRVVGGHLRLPLGRYHIRAPSMNAESPYMRHLLRHLRTSVLVVAVVALGLGLYSFGRGEELQWYYIVLVAAGMLLSSIVNMFVDAAREKRGTTKR